MTNFGKCFTIFIIRKSSTNNQQSNYDYYAWRGKEQLAALD